MSWLIGGAAVVAALLLGSAAFYFSRSRPVATVLLGLGLVVLAAGDLGPRALASRDVRSDCLVARVSPASSSPLVWQAVTGGVVMEAHVAPEDVAAMVEDRLVGTPFDGADVRLVEGAVRVDGEVASALGSAQISADVEPEVAGDELTWQLGAVMIGGRLVPERLLGDGGNLADLAEGQEDGRCGAGERGHAGSVRSAVLDPDGLTLRLTL